MGHTQKISARGASRLLEREVKGEVVVKALERGEVWWKCSAEVTSAGLELTLP